MRIAVGIDSGTSPADIDALIAAGADEFFAGYVPQAWSDTYGWEVCPNRRTYGPQCQFTDLDDLRGALDKVHGKGKRLTVAFNAHEYRAEVMQLLRDIVLEAESAEPDAYVVADPALVLEFGRWGISRPLHLSTGTACYNSETVRYLCGLGDVRRVVLPRKMTCSEMAELTSRLSDLDLEFEAMVVGYRCFFNDEFCFSWHSGKGDNLCSEFTRTETRTSPRFPANWKQLLEHAIECPEDQLEPGSPLDQLCRSVSGDGGVTDVANLSTRDPENARVSSLLLSTTLVNCGLCAIPLLREAGVRVLKVPVRGDEWQKMKYVKLVRAALEQPDLTPEFCRNLVGNAEFCDSAFSCYYHRTEET